MVLGCRGVYRCKGVLVYGCRVYWCIGVWVEWWKVIVIVFDYGNYGKSGKKNGNGLALRARWGCLFFLVASLKILEKSI